MRKLALIPLLTLVFACNDSTLIEPESNPGITADQEQAREPRQEYTFQFQLEGPLPPEPPPPIQDGDFSILRGVSNSFVVEGELAGYAYFTGGATLNTITGEAYGSGGMLLVLNAPEVGAFMCRWRATWEGFFASSDGEWYECRGTGGFEGMKLRALNNNDRDPAVTDGTAVIWGRQGPRSDS